MDFASEIQKIKSFESDDTVLLEKVRWSIRQRLRKQMQLLDGDFFDAVDDFLFSGGQQGQFSESANYINSMRELRAKQNLFEEKFLDAVVREIKASYGKNAYNADDYDESPSAELDAALEQVEIDLALQAMSRKACKVYRPFIKQIDAIQSKASYPVSEKVIEGDVLIDATLDAFSRAHHVFAIPLEIRLVFLKLFEQNFLLKMEKLFLDMISIINNLSDDRFVEKLYTSSSAFRTKITKRSEYVSRLGKNRSKLASQGAQKAQSTEASVDQFISTLCANRELPEFAERMLRTRWRAVMFLIGLNRGSNSVQWNEARHTASLLASCLSDSLSLSREEWKAMVEQLKQGFVLVQLGKSEQEDFLLELQQHLQLAGKEELLGARNMHLDATELAGGAAAGNQTPGSDASISPSGEEILDQEDLDDLAQLLGNGEEEGFKASVKRGLADLLPQIDALGEHAAVQYNINGVFEDCILCRSLANPELYTINNRNTNFCINRSRLGLAIALQDGELKIPNINPSHLSGARTVIQADNQTRH
ncbi:MAG: DUF1631 family protein [Proteobacteria bacterium]|nr:DUF1631 family protein [Pseudomonadota bacterium]